MNLEAYLVNAFAEEIACGNPAGVVLHGDPLPDDLMQRIATDLARSETAFVHAARGSDVLRIRWFTPLREVGLCGHATLAAAKVLFGAKGRDRFVFEYAGGSLPVARSPDGSISMDFPLDDYERIPIEPAWREFFGTPEIEECICGTATNKVVLVLDEAVDLGGIAPDFARMATCSGRCRHGIGITKRSTAFDFESRYFNPWYGVNEDPVTGSVHTLLARYWSDVLGKHDLIARQTSHRPGTLVLRVRDDRVEMEGRAFILLKGSLNVP
jgi:PhzF family phenazine biosynthesis protein